MKTRFASFLGSVFLVIAGCGSGEKQTSPQTGEDAGTDADAAGLADQDGGRLPDLDVSDRQDGGADRPILADEAPQPDGKALVVPMATNPPTIAVMTLLESGGILDRGIRIEGGIAARSVAVRQDCREVVVPYAGSGVGTEKGAVVIEIEPDGSSAAKVQTLTVP